MNSSPSVMSESAVGAPSRNSRREREWASGSDTLSASISAPLYGALNAWKIDLCSFPVEATPDPVFPADSVPPAAPASTSGPVDAPTSHLEPIYSRPRLWVAFSGGLDSTLLLHACARLIRFGMSNADHAGFRLAAVHIDHGLQSESAAWAAHCQSCCEALGIPLEIRRLALRPEPGQSLEAVAREARYKVFRELLGPGDALMTAQHRDDQAETLLLALLRGSGPAGLAGMGAQGRLGSGWLLRPFLALPKSALQAEAARLGLHWIEDPSNACLDHERNRLRHQVLPLLAGPERKSAGNSDPSLMLARSAAHCAEAQGLLDELADELIAGLSGSRPQTLSVRGLLALGQSQSGSSGKGRSRLRLVLRRWIRRRGALMPSEVVLERIIDELLPARPDRNPLVAWRGCEARRYRDDCYLLSPLPPPFEGALPWEDRQPLSLPAPLGQLHLVMERETGMGQNSGSLIDAGIQCAVQVRASIPAQMGSVQTGSVQRHSIQRCSLQTGQGFHRDLKHLFQEAGIPPWLRPLVPMLVCDHEILAIPGLYWHPRLAAGALHWRDHPWEDFGFFLPSGG